MAQKTKYYKKHETNWSKKRKQEYIYLIKILKFRNF